MKNRSIDELCLAKDLALMTRKAEFRSKMDANGYASNYIAIKVRNTKDGSPANLKAKSEYARLKKEGYDIAEEWNNGTWRERNPYFCEYKRRIIARSKSRKIYPMKTNKITIREIEKKIRELVDAIVLAPCTCIYEDYGDDGVQTGKLCLDICHFVEGSRTLDVDGRSELALQDAAESDLIKLCGGLGSVTLNGTGCSEYGPVNCYEIGL